MGRDASHQAGGPGDALYMGIDGGAGKTAGVIVNATGAVVAQRIAPGMIVVGDPTPEIRGALAGMVQSLCADAGVDAERIALCAAGLSGAQDLADELPVQHAALAHAAGLHPERFALVNDGIVALWGATDSPAAVILQHGSGFTSALRDRPGNETLYDHLNVGHTFDIRNELLVRVARMIDGRLHATPLLEAVLQHLGVRDARDFPEALYRPTIPREQLRNTPPLVFDAWLAGDPVAGELVQAAIEDYALTVSAMARRTGAKGVVAVLGGGVILRTPRVFWERLTARIRALEPAVARVTPPELEPVLGAAVMAASRNGRDPAEFFRLVQSQRATPPHEEGPR